ncbi:MAG: threonine ammonia-lyase [Planctomycetaceae bacterium]|nr:threonine ammonia-lyase [Planctomycetaceae bacterium]
MNVRDIEQAHATLHKVLHAIPLSSSRTFSRMSGAELFLKCENLQKTGSFKVRGAYNKISKLAKRGDVPSVVAASAGNHAQGVAFSASTLGVESTIVMPLATPIAKVRATQDYGANVVLHGACYDDAYAKACEIMEESGATFVHPFDDEDIIAGQGTVAIEIFRDMPTVDMVLVPAGGGGLLAGIAYYIKSINPRVKVIGVQAEGADALVRSFRAERLESTSTVHTIADGIAVKQPGDLTFDFISRYVDDMVTVSDDEIAESILLLLERNKMVVEPAGAVSLAAALSKKVEIAGLRTVCVLSGGNIDVSFIHKIVEKGLITRGRQIKFRTIMSDLPGSLTHFSSIVAACRANVIMVQHDRLSPGLGLNDAILHMACEVGGREHGEELFRRLKEAGYEIIME